MEGKWLWSNFRYYLAGLRKTTRNLSKGSALAEIISGDLPNTNKKR